MGTMHGIIHNNNVKAAWDAITQKDPQSGVRIAGTQSTIFLNQVKEASVGSNRTGLEVNPCESSLPPWG